MIIKFTHISSKERDLYKAKCNHDDSKNTFALCYFTFVHTFSLIPCYPIDILGTRVGKALSHFTDEDTE